MVYGRFSISLGGTHEEISDYFGIFGPASHPSAEHPTKTSPRAANNPDCINLPAGFLFESALLKLYV
jgi:hypothetical protein